MISQGKHHQTRVKVCGITRVEQAYAISKAGADAIGIVFYKPSARAVLDLSLAADIALATGPFTNVFGLFVDAPKRMIDEVVSRVPIDGLQFHGNETPDFCSSFDRPYLKALRMKPGIDIDTQIKAYTNARGILLDTYVKGVPGGTGEAFDWHKVPQNTKSPIVLAGGLNPSNVASAIQIAKPYAVDVSGGVEVENGNKDLKLVTAFINNAKKHLLAE